MNTYLMRYRVSIYRNQDIDTIMNIGIKIAEFYPKLNYQEDYHSIYACQHIRL
jgi:hypothetical protein